MIRHAKASPAGSTHGQGSGLGRFFRGAFATCGASSEATGSGARSHRPRSFALPLATFAALCALCLSAAPASAVTAHVFLNSFTGTAVTGANCPTDAGQAFSTLNDVAVDNSTNLVDPSRGDVYVVDSGHGLVDRFSVNPLTGAPTCEGQITGSGVPGGVFGTTLKGISVDPATGNVWVIDATHLVVDEFSPTGAYITQITGTPTAFSVPLGVAVDASSDIYVSDNSAATPVIDKFSSSTAFQLSLACTVATPCAANNSWKLEDIGGLSVDGSGNVYAVDSNNTSPHAANIDKFNSSGVFQQTVPIVPGGSNSGIAASPTSNDFYVGHGSNVQYENPFGTPVEAFGAGHVDNTRGLAVSASGYVYVGDGRATTKTVVVFEPVTLPSVSVSATSNQQLTSATLNGTVNPDGSAVTNCHFEYVTEVAFQATGFSNLSSGGTIPCNPEAALIPVDSSDHAVKADVTGLQSQTAYRFRLVASNVGGTSRTQAEAFESSGPPKIDNQFVSQVTSTEAIVNADVNPYNADTTYEFQYGTDTSYGSGTLPVTPGNLGAGAVDQLVSIQFTGLAPSTVYHYRVIAFNSFAPPEGVMGPDQTFATNPGLAGPPTTACPNAAARQGASAALPDCRAYEQMTPAAKGVAEDMFGEIEGTNYSIGSPSEDGERYFLSTTASLGVNGVSGENAYVFSRAPGGWETTSLAVEGLGVQDLDALNYFFDPADLSTVAFKDELGSFTAGRRALVFVGSPGGPYSTLPEGVDPAGGSTDLSHVVLEGAQYGIAPGDSGQVAGNALYEWFAGGLRLVNMNSAGSLESTCGAILGQGHEENGGTHNAVSSDGSKIFFTAPDPRAPEGSAGCWGKRGTSPEVDPPQLYVRVDGTKTIDVSAPAANAGEPSTLHAAVYVGASADGSKVFFVSRGELTADDTTHAAELYEYDTETSTLTRVSRGDSGNAEGAVDFVGAISSDGSTVYFTAHGQLAPGVPALEAGQVYLYRYDTLTEQTTLVARVGANGYPLRPTERLEMWTNEALPTEGRGAKEVGSDDESNWYTTADGRYLVFGSNQDITGYDSTKATGVQCEGLYGEGTVSARCLELYRYDAADNSIVCVSCGLPGVPPVDNAQFARSAARNAAGASPRPISENGEYVFFDTASSLVSQASPGEIHVYEWHEGAVSLLSAPHDPANSFFMGSSADGANVFIGTHSQLVSQDTDVEGDLYDVRIDGGFGSVTPPLCTGTGCQGVPAAPPIFATPSSVTFEGAGNLPAPAKSKAKGLTKAQKLKAALKACKRDRVKRKRARCEAQARARYVRALKSVKSIRGGN